MGVLDKFEGSVEDAFDRTTARVFKGTIEPAQIARKAEKQMKRERLVGAGKQYAPTLYTVLISTRDNRRLFAFFPTMAAEIESYLFSRGADAGLSFDGRPLVRFIVDQKLKIGRFDVIAESVSAQTIEQLREEEARYLGLKTEIDDIWADHANTDHADADHADANQSESVQSDSQEEAVTSLPGVTVVAARRRFEPPTDPIEPASGFYYLVNQSTGRQYDLEVNRLSIGRGEENDIVVDDSNASRQHAVLTQNALGIWKIIDLGSTNGTLVNGKAVDQTVLRENDRLTIGVTVLALLEDRATGSRFVKNDGRVKG